MILCYSLFSCFVIYNDITERLLVICHIHKQTAYEYIIYMNASSTRTHTHTHTH